MIFFIGQFWHPWAQIQINIAVNMWPWLLSVCLSVCLDLSFSRSIFFTATNAATSNIYITETGAPWNQDITSFSACSKKSPNQLPAYCVWGIEGFVRPCLELKLTHIMFCLLSGMYRRQPILCFVCFQACINDNQYCVLFAFRHVLTTTNIMFCLFSGMYRRQQGYGNLSGGAWSWHRLLRQWRLDGAPRHRFLRFPRDRTVSTHRAGLNTLRLKQNGCCFADISKCIFLYEHVECQAKFHWNLFVGVQFIVIQHWFRQWCGFKQATIHYLNWWWWPRSMSHVWPGLKESNLVSKYIHVSWPADVWCV